MDRVILKSIVLFMLSACDPLGYNTGLIATKVENKLPGSWKIASFTVDQSDSMDFIRKLHLQGNWGFGSKNSYSDVPFNVTSKGDTLYSYEGSWNDTNDGKTFYLSFFSALHESPEGSGVGYSTANKFFVNSAWSVKTIDDRSFVISRNVKGAIQVLRFIKN